MGLQENLLDQKSIDFVVDSFQTHHAEFLKHNKDLYDISEGNLFVHIDKHLQKEFKEQSYAAIRSRIAPINLLNKIVDKKSKIYQQAPVRTIDGKAKRSRSDKDLVAWYEHEMGFNARMNYGNEIFNRAKSVLYEPFAAYTKPHIRAISNHLFLVWSVDGSLPNRPTHAGVVYGLAKSLDSGKDVMTYRVYSDSQFMICDSEKNLRTDLMAAVGNNKGENAIEALPFVYANRSESLLIPQPDISMYTMTVLLPVLLSDLNFAHKFSCFSIMYGIGVNQDKLRFAPNAFWEIEMDPKSEQKPEIGIIKPEADIEKGLMLIQAQLSMWLSSLSIKPGSIGTLTESSFASGISKMIDEMDTVEDRKKQVSIYIPVERQIWDLILNKMHPYWADQKLIENNASFTPDNKVVTTFAEQIPLLSRGELVTTLKNEKEAGFISRKSAMKKLNPEWTEEQIDEEIQAILAEQTEARKVMTQTFGQSNDDASDEEE
jgi:hypothetical protein